MLPMSQLYTVIYIQSVPTNVSETETSYSGLPLPQSYKLVIEFTCDIGYSYIQQLLPSQHYNHRNIGFQCFLVSVLFVSMICNDGAHSSIQPSKKKVILPPFDLPHINTDTVKCENLHNHNVDLGTSSLLACQVNAMFKTKYKSAHYFEHLNLFLGQRVICTVK